MRVPFLYATFIASDPHKIVSKTGIAVHFRKSPLDKKYVQPMFVNFDFKIAGVEAV